MKPRTLTLELYEPRCVLASVWDVSVGSEVAIASGAWHTPSIWASGSVPGAGDDVHIPDGIAVSLQTDASANRIRIDGSLQLESGCDLQLDVDTILVRDGGEYIDGTAVDPVIATHSILFRDDGPIDTTWDTEMITRGLVSMGSVEMHGDTKTSHVKAAPPMAGDTVIWLEEAVGNWSVGDQILIAGTHRPTVDTPSSPAVNQDELRTIVDIDFGRQITIDTPLVYNHDTPSLTSLGGAAPFRPDVANLTRSITLRSENTTDPTRAAHTMYMTTDTYITAVALDELGRTNKGIKTTDASGNNRLGRYAIHIHRHGAGDTVTVSNSVVTNSPGWGFVNHSSDVDWIDNVGYANLGAHFVAEAGDEVGTFRGNLAVWNDAWVNGRHFNKLGATDKGGGDGLQFGSTGNGYWMQSPYVSLIDNTAASMLQQGFVLHGRPLSFDPVTPPAQGVRFLGALQGFEVYGSGSGIHTGWHRPGLDIDDTVSGFEVWNIAWEGLRSRYTTGLTWQDGIVHSEISKTYAHTPGVDDNAAHYGFVTNFNSANFAIKDVVFENWKTGVQAPPTGDFLLDEVTIDAQLNGVVVTPEGDNYILGQITPQNVVATDVTISAPTDWLYL